MPWVRGTYDEVQPRLLCFCMIRAKLNGLMVSWQLQLCCAAVNENLCLWRNKVLVAVEAVSALSGQGSSLEEKVRPTVFTLWFYSMNSWISSVIPQERVKETWCGKQNLPGKPKIFGLNLLVAWQRIFVIKSRPWEAVRRMWLTMRPYFCFQWLLSSLCAEENTQTLWERSVKPVLTHGALCVT